MREARPIPLPVRGVNKKLALDNLITGFSADANNVWVLNATDGRVRLAVRPSLIDVATLGGSRCYSSTKFTWIDSGVAEVRAAFTTSNGTYTSDDGTTWALYTDVAPGVKYWPNTATAAAFNGKMFQAVSGNAAVRLTPFSSGLPGVANLTASAGSVPTKCGIVIAHGGRLWLMGDTDNPSVYYASAIGDETDWDYANVTTAGAFASTGSDGGKIGEPIVAAFSHNSACLLIFSTSSTYAVQGNPRDGNIERISSVTGALMQSAVCQDGQGRTWILSKRGLFYIPPGMGQEPIPVSDRYMPDDLVDIDPSNNGSTHGDLVSIGYDHRWPGIHIFVNYDGGTDKSYFYDIDNEAFCPQTVNSYGGACVTFPEIQTDNRSSLLFCSDGADVYQFRRDAEGGDTDETFDSYARIIFPLARDGKEGLLQAIQCTLDQGSASVAYELRFGDTAREAFEKSTADYSGTWSYDAGPPKRFVNAWAHPRRRGAWCDLKLENVGNSEKWIIERLMQRSIEMGMLRAGGL